jgi:hypothetical protein
MLLLLVQVMAEALLEFWQQHYRPHTGTASCHHLSLSPVNVKFLTFSSTVFFVLQESFFYRADAIIDMKKRSFW